jgi:hypothetical protein
MFESTKTNDLKGAYLSPASHTNAENFFGDEQTGVTNKIGRFVSPATGVVGGWN